MSIVTHAHYSISSFQFSHSLLLRGAISLCGVYLTFRYKSNFDKNKEFSKLLPDYYERYGIMPNTDINLKLSQTVYQVTIDACSKYHSCWNVSQCVSTNHNWRVFWISQLFGTCVTMCVCSVLQFARHSKTSITEILRVTHLTYGTLRYPSQ